MAHTRPKFERGGEIRTKRFRGVPHYLQRQLPLGVRETAPLVPISLRIPPPLRVVPMAPLQVGLQIRILNC